MASCFALLLAIGADLSAQDEPDSPPAIIVRPADRLAWRETISTAVAEAYLFVAYVDDEPTFLDAACAPAADGVGAFDCSAPLPALTPGRHRIEVSALTGEHERKEGERSDAIFVALQATAGKAPITGAIGDLSAGAPIRVVADGLEDPVDIAIVREGLVVIAERRGRILGVTIDEAAAAVEMWTTTIDRDQQLLSIAAVDAKYLFAVYLGPESASLVRYAVSSRGLTDRSVIVDGLPAGSGAAVLRQGPDGMLYLALAAHSSSSESLGDAGSWRGKVLRLNRDGSLPRDTPAVAFAPSAYDPRDLVWRGSEPWLLSSSDSGIVTLMPLQPLWSRSTARSAGITLLESLGARTVAVTSEGNLIVSGSSSSVTIRIDPVDGRASVSRYEPTSAPIIRRADDLKHLFICTTTGLVIQSKTTP